MTSKTCGYWQRREQAVAEKIERLRAILAEQYGIHTDEELLEAVKAQKGTEIGIFVSGCGKEQRG